MFKPAQKDVWKGRVDDEHDPSAFRFHQVVKSINAKDLPDNERVFGIIGYAGDEGVRRNQGRQGAAHAPQQIRRQLAKLPCHLQDDTMTADVGDVVCEGTNMEEAQSELGHHVTDILNRGATPIILGGGHETLYGHYLGVREYIGAEASIGVINIDAHFDMRDDPMPSSGTMFRQIMEQDDDAGYLCLGIQPFGNTQALFDTANHYGCQYVFASDIDTQKTTAVIDEFCREYDYVMVTLCTDSIISSAAPGVSAPAPLGLDPKTVARMLKYIVGQSNVLSFDISEVNPLVDEGGQTVRLAAYLLAETMQAFHRF